MTETIQYSCENCSHSDDRDNLIEINDLLYCVDCSITCERCDYRVGEDYIFIEDCQARWCESCASNYAIFCPGCDCSLANANFYSVLGTGSSYTVRYCEQCCDSNYTWCGSCDCYFDNECSCKPDYINDYSYKPTPIFQPDLNSKLYFGVEIETEIWSGDIAGSTEFAQDKDDYYYLKRDSSIGGQYDGYEIVTHPYTFDFWHTQDNPTLEFVDHIREDYKARSWDAKSSCGLHIHISRDGFTSGAHTHRFLAFIYNNPVQMSKLGGRKGSKYASFSDVYKYDDYGRPYKDISSKLKRHSSERYSAVNTNNEHTLELRWFQGTLNRDGILSHIQLAHAMVEFTRYMTVAQVRDGALRWDRFSEYVADNMHIYPQLHAKVLRLDSTSIYTNRPVMHA